MRDQVQESQVQESHYTKKNRFKFFRKLLSIVYPVNNM